MARWSEEQERWMGRGDRYDEDERRFREERGEEGGWRGRDWRDEGRWRGGERDWRERDWRAPERGRFVQGEGEWYGGQGRREEGYGERWHAEPRRSEWRRGGERAGGGEPYAGARGRAYGAGEYGDSSTYGSSAGEWGYGRDEARRDYERDYRRYGPYGREEQGPMERFGEKLREGMRKLTGRGPKGYRRSDDRIRDEVSEQIARSWVNAENVEVKVENGEVTLTGFVESREDKRRIEDIAEDVYGVDEVNNHLRIQRTGQAAGQAGVQAGTGTTGTGAAMSAQQQAGRTAGSQPHQTGRH